MITLRIRHRTTYAYRRPVSLGPHLQLLRPREGRDLRLISTEIKVTPEGALTWGQDVFGNAVATVIFSTMTDVLAIDAAAEVELHASAWPVFDIAASAIVYPFRYSEDEWTDLGAMTVQQYADPDGRLRRWARDFVAGNRTDTLSLLKDLSAGVPCWIGYQSRDDEGVQSPVRTLARGWGSCRDFAVLFAEAARSLGFGARIISGYLFNPDERLAGTSAAGSTALSRCRRKSAMGRQRLKFQAAVTASRQVLIAAARKVRCVEAEVRWRWTLKVLKMAA